MLNRLNRWHGTKLGLFLFGLIELAISYGFISLAIDRGNLWWYLLALIFFVGALNNWFRVIGDFFRGQR